MINVQNEIRYAIAAGMLQKLLAQNAVTQEEWEAANRLLAEKYRPFAVCELS